MRLTAARYARTALAANSKVIPVRAPVKAALAGSTNQSWDPPPAGSAPLAIFVLAVELGSLNVPLEHMRVMAAHRVRTALVDSINRTRDPPAARAALRAISALAAALGTLLVPQEHTRVVAAHPVHLVLAANTKAAQGRAAARAALADNTNQARDPPAVQAVQAVSTKQTQAKSAARAALWAMPAAVAEVVSLHASLAIMRLVAAVPVQLVHPANSKAPPVRAAALVAPVDSIKSAPAKSTVLRARRDITPQRLVHHLRVPALHAVRGHTRLWLVHP